MGVLLLSYLGGAFVTGWFLLLLGVLVLGCFVCCFRAFGFF